MNNYTIDLQFDEIIEEVDKIFRKYKRIVKSIYEGELNCRNKSYAFGLVYSFYISELCGYTEFDIIEFGVGSAPKGLLDLKTSAEKIQTLAATDFKFNIIGFDRTDGMPKATSYKDHPEIWHENVWGINENTILDAPYAKIYDGELQETIPRYIKDLEVRNYKIGFISFDLDQYQGTKIATNVLKIDTNFLMPLVPMHWDDLKFNPLMSEFTGPYLAAKEFNTENELRKVDLKQLDIYYTTSFLQVYDHPYRNGLEKSLYPLFLCNLGIGH